MSALSRLIAKLGGQLAEHPSERTMLRLSHKVYVTSEARAVADRNIQFTQRSAASNAANNPTPPTPVRGNLSRPLRSSLVDLLNNNPGETLIETNNTPSNLSERPPGPSKIGLNISMRFKDNTKKFSGALDESWNEFFKEYKLALADYNVPPDEQFQYMRHVLPHKAKCYFLQKIVGHADNISLANEMMVSQYNSTARQKCIENKRNSIRFDKYVTDSKDDTKALKNLESDITKLAPKGTTHCQNDASLIGYLRKAVFGHNWATLPIARLDTENLSYQEFYT
ncbi:hypothetical protein FGB62_50g26 [Gracilaria domingensis]|nr:hypothetical protein FGB62_50g26 [Gracilaria domingensis]